jgi:hypothetical protein
MHALLPDKVTLKSGSTGADIGLVDFGDIILEKGTAVNTTTPLADLFTTLGMGEAGQGARPSGDQGTTDVAKQKGLPNCPAP